eukprot:TRINITY_DN5398_c0_g1_i1.p1 TRINITY_DN5398_c0_g1~~TRINITY_DN5398_c0_g1_i1.p1  ORF type:complete len:770 (+),score=153.50 TRINITY_DN5398_c0_g1_i1:52-2310(+)
MVRSATPPWTPRSLDAGSQRSAASQSPQQSFDLQQNCGTSSSAVSSSVAAVAANATSSTLPAGPSSSSSSNEEAPSDGRNPARASPTCWPAGRARRQLPPTHTQSGAPAEDQASERTVGGRTATDATRARPRACIRQGSRVLVSRAYEPEQPWDAERLPSAPYRSRQHSSLPAYPGGDREWQPEWRRPDERRPERRRPGLVSVYSPTRPETAVPSEWELARSRKCFSPPPIDGPVPARWREPARTSPPLPPPLRTTVLPRGSYRRSSVATLVAVYTRTAAGAAALVVVAASAAPRAPVRAALLTRGATLVRGPVVCSGASCAKPPGQSPPPRAAGLQRAGGSSSGRCVSPGLPRRQPPASCPPISPGGPSVCGTRAALPFGAADAAQPGPGTQPPSTTGSWSEGHFRVAAEEELYSSQSTCSSSGQDRQAAAEARLSTASPAGTATPIGRMRSDATERSSAEAAVEAIRPPEEFTLQPSEAEVFEVEEMPPDEPDPVHPEPAAVQRTEGVRDVSSDGILLVRVAVSPPHQDPPSPPPSPPRTEQRSPSPAAPEPLGSPVRRATARAEVTWCLVEEFCSPQSAQDADADDAVPPQHRRRFSAGDAKALDADLGAGAPRFDAGAPRCGAERMRATPCPPSAPATPPSPERRRNSAPVGEIRARPAAVPSQRVEAPLLPDTVVVAEVSPRLHRLFELPDIDARDGGVSPLQATQESLTPTAAVVRWDALSTGLNSSPPPAESDPGGAASQLSRLF